MKTKNQYIKEYHILLNQCGITPEGKEAIMASYGVESSKDMNVAQLSELCGKLHEELRKAGKETAVKAVKSPIELARTQVKVAVGKWLAAKGEIPASGWLLPEWNKITGIACRAAQVGTFNQIPLSKLRGIVFEFNKQRKAMENTRNLLKTDNTWHEAKQQ